MRYELTEIADDKSIHVANLIARQSSSIKDAWQRVAGLTPEIAGNIWDCGYFINSEIDNNIN